MIHQAEDHAARLGRHGAQAALHRRELPQAIIRIHHKNCFIGGAQTGSNLAGAMAQHHDHRRANPGKARHQMIQKRFAANVQQRLGRAHAPRFTGSQNQAGDLASCHLGSDRCNSSAKMDLDTDCQLDTALRRTAIISAATEMAISSGETAPISRPIGA